MCVVFSVGNCRYFEVRKPFGNTPHHPTTPHNTTQLPTSPHNTPQHHTTTHLNFQSDSDFIFLSQTAVYVLQV